MVRLGPRMGPTTGPLLGPNAVGDEGGPSSIFTVEPGDSFLYVADYVLMNIVTDGQGPYHLSSTGSLPVEVSAGTDYYAIRTVGDVGVANDTIKIATSLANALAATYVEINDAGTGTHTIAYAG